MQPFAINQQPPLPQTPRPIVSIGGGGIVHNAHYPAYAKAGFPVAGLFDLNQARAQALAQKFGVPVVFDNLAAAVAGAPSGAVFDVAVPASALPGILPHLPDGSPVLIQKPLGESLAQAGRIAQICQEKRLRAAVNFQMRYAPFVLAARSLIAQGAIGELLDVEVRVTVYTPWALWPFLEDVHQPEFYYHSIHYMDLIRSFLGEPRGVSASAVTHPNSRIDGARTTTVLGYGPTARGVINTNHRHAYGLRHQESYVKWEGTGGAIVARMGVLMNYPQGEEDWFEYCVLEEGQEPNWQRVPLQGRWFPDAFIGSMASVMRAADDPSQPPATAVADALKTMAVVDAACRSDESGGTSLRPVE